MCQQSMCIATSEKAGLQGALQCAAALQQTPKGAPLAARNGAGGNTVQAGATHELAFVVLVRNHDVHLRRLGGNNVSSDARFRQVDLRAVRFVDGDRLDLAGRLGLHALAVDDFEGGDAVFENNGTLLAAVHGDGTDLAFDLNGRVVAFVDVHRLLRALAFDRNRRVAFLEFDHPFLALELENRVLFDSRRTIRLCRPGTHPSTVANAGENLRRAESRTQGRDADSQTRAPYTARTTGEAHKAFARTIPLWGQPSLVQSLT